ncbi:MAG: hypothetical protein HRF49_07640 [bacterium]|jgi:hypothetical protein
MARFERLSILDMDGTTRIGIRNVEFNPLQVEVADDERVVGTIDPYAGRVLRKWYEASFTTDLRGLPTTGTLGTAIPEAPLWKSAGYKQTLVTATSSTYALTATPDTDKVVIATQKLHVDGLQHIGTSIVSDLTVKGVAGEIVECNWRTRGLWSANPSETSNPTINEDAGLPIRFYGASTLTVGGATLTVREFELRTGNVIDPTPSGAGTYGFAAAKISGRRCTMSLLVEAPAVSTYDFWEQLQTAASGIFGPVNQVAVAISLGQTAKNRFAFTMKGFMNAAPQIEIVNGVVCYRIELLMVPTGTAFYPTFVWT